ncbi:MAG: recombinase family protein [Methylocella sp.]
MIYGYARVSTDDQDLTIQRTALRQAGCAMIREEKRSGTKLDGRAELQTLLDFIQPGDTLVVTRIDRLARSVLDLQTIVAKLKERGAALRCTEQPIDMTTPAGKAFLDMLSVFAEFETALRRERQMEGIAKAQREGRYKGRPPTVDNGAIQTMHRQGKRVVEIMSALGVSRSSVERALRKAQPASLASSPSTTPPPM